MTKMTQEREDYLVEQYLNGNISLGQVVLDGLGVLEEEAPKEERQP